MKICRSGTLTSLFILIIILVAAVPGCTGEPVIEQAVVSSSVLPTGEAGLAADTFLPDVGTIYCSVKLSDISKKPLIKVEWMVSKSDAAGLKDYLMGAESIAADRQYTVFAFARAEKLLPAGDYEVKLYVGDKFVRSVPFKVEGEASESKVTLSELTICTSVIVETNEPLDRFTVLPNDAGIIFCTARVKDADFGTVFKASWIYLKGEVQGVTDKVFAEGKTRPEGLAYIGFSISPAGGKPLPVGDYAVKLYVENKVLGTVPFKIVASSSIPGPYLSQAATFKWIGSENQTSELTNIFAADAEEINCKVRVNNAPPGTELKMQWMLLKSADGNISDRSLNEDVVQVTGTRDIVGSISRGKDPFPAGNYLVKFVLGGEEKLFILFKVQ